MAKREEYLELIKVDVLPHVSAMNPGVIYFNEEFQIASHLCCCGCETETVTPFETTGLFPRFWQYKMVESVITIEGSIFNPKCQAHYFIKENLVQFV